MEQTDDRAAVEALVRALNDAWLAERIEDLGAFFDENAVLVAPGGARRIVGREAVVESYRQYVELARTLAFEVQDLAIDVFGATAVARLAFRVRYGIGETIHDEGGCDLLVLGKGDGGWRVVWRTQVPEEEPHDAG